MKLSEMVKIGMLTPRSRGVNLIARVVEKAPERTVSSQYDQSIHRLSELLIADETGAISLILWDDNVDKVSEGDTIRVSNGFVKLFRGRMQLNIGRYGSVEIAGEDEVIDNINTENNLSMRQFEALYGRSGGRRLGRRR